MDDPPKKQQRKRPKKPVPGSTDDPESRRALQHHPRGRQPRTGRSPPALRWKRVLQARSPRALSADSTSSAPSCSPTQASATPSARAPPALDTPFRAFPFDAPKTTASGHHAAPSASTDTTEEAPTSAASTDDGASCPSTGDTKESAGTFFSPTASMIGADTTSSRTDAITSPEASPVRPESPSLSSPPLNTTESTAPDEGPCATAVVPPVGDEDPADGPSSNDSRPRTPTPVAEGTGQHLLRNSPLPLAAAEDAQACQSAAVHLKHAARMRHRFRRFVDFEPNTPPADGGVAHDTTVTVLYRPMERKATFLALSRHSIAAQLCSVPGVRRVRVNFRRNVVAADVTRDPPRTVRHRDESSLSPLSGASYQPTFGSSNNCAPSVLDCPGHFNVTASASSATPAPPASATPAASAAACFSELDWSISSPSEELGSGTATLSARDPSCVRDRVFAGVGSTATAGAAGIVVLSSGTPGWATTAG
nr:mucin-5AC-like [Dermacentor andersoni]